MKRFTLGVVATVVALGLTVAASAAPVVLIDGNSTAKFDPTTQAGLYSWNVDGHEYMNQQWFWWRVGSTAEQPIDNTSLNLAFSHTSDANFDGNDDTLFARYLDRAGRFKVELTFLLIGGNHTSDMAETIKITNTGTTALDYHFFQYVDFNLSASDTVWFPNDNTVRQTGSGIEVAETVVVPVPPRREAAVTPTTLNELNDASPTTLGYGGGAVTGDVSWAFQWDVSLNPGQSLIISKDKNIVPEPATLALLASGMVATLVMRRRRRA